MRSPHSFTFISRSAPYGSNRAQLCLDMALAAGIFEQKINYVFMDDGVFQLLKYQDGSMINSKTIGNALETLELYGIQNIYACSTAMKQRHLAIDDLVCDTRIISNENLKSILNDSDIIINL